MFMNKYLAELELYQREYVWEKRPKHLWGLFGNHSLKSLFYRFLMFVGWLIVPVGMILQKFGKEILDLVRPLCESNGVQIPLFIQSFMTDMPEYAVNLLSFWTVMYFIGCFFVAFACVFFGGKGNELLERPTWIDLVSRDLASRMLRKPTPQSLLSDWLKKGDKFFTKEAISFMDIGNWYWFKRLLHDVFTVLAMVVTAHFIWAGIFMVYTLILWVFLRANAEVVFKWYKGLSVDDIAILKDEYVQPKKEVPANE